MIVGVAGIILLSVGAVILTLLTWTDVREFRLPDRLNALLAGCGLLFNATSGMPLTRIEDAAIGAVAGTAVLWGLREIFWRLRGRDGLGLGDIKFVAAASCWVGWQGLPMVILVGSLATIVVTILAGLIVRRGGVGATTVLPFGPGLCGGLAATMLWLLSSVSA